MNFRLQNRYQDSGWEDIPGLMSRVVAVDEAWKMAKDAVRNGMVRVVSEDGKEVFTTYGAGVNNGSPGVFQDQYIADRKRAWELDSEEFRAFGKECQMRVSMWPDWKKQAMGIPLGPHISPNGAKPGSVVHDAEAWCLSQGLTIPLQSKYRHMFQAMLDDYSESKCRSTSVPVSSGRPAS